ncbi:MAG TPA: helicase-related protein [Saprospiraceae bacterium]|nr:helicase-related protein [Saprospiraceae bacterium]
MPNPKLNKLYQLYKDNQPELLGGMDEESFVAKFSDNEKLGKLFDITNEQDAEMLGGLQRDQYIAKFGESRATKYFTAQMDAMKNQASTEPRVGVSSPKALGKVTQEEALIEKPIHVAQESTANKPILDPNLGKNPFELVDLKDKDPLQEGVKNIRNYEERKKEGDKANPERTTYNLGMEAINNSYNQANSNIDKVKIFVNNQKGKEDAFDYYMADLQAVSNSIDSDPEKKNPNTNKLIDQFNKEWGDIQNSEMVGKYLFPSLEFLGKMQDSRNKVKDSVPNYTKYLDDIQKEQAESDKIDYTTGGGFLKGAANKLKRVIGGTFLGNIAAIGKGLTDSQVFYDIGEYAKQTEELNPSATRHQRSTVEDYVHDEETGLDMVFDDSVNGQTPQFQYFVDPKTGNMANVIITDAIQKKIDQYAKDKKFESRRVGGAIVSQGVDELIEELPELALTVATDGLLSAGMKGLRAAKITSQSNKILRTAKTLANTKIAKDITAKHVGAHVGELLSGTIEGSADYREEGLKAGLSEDEVSAFQLAAGLNAGISDAINPMEVVALKKDIDIFFKKKLADYAAGKITKTALLKETGASFILNTSKNLAKETVSEGIVEPLVGNKIRKTFNELKGTDFKETDINPRSIEAGFWLSAVSSGAFSVPTSMRVSKGGLMADAIKYAVNNPEELQAYFKGRRAAQGGQALDRENYLKSVIDQVNDAGLSKPDKEQAALLMIDRQNASLEVEELEKKYGADAPLVKKKRNELFDIEGKIDDIFSKEKAPQQEAQAEPEAPPPPQAEEEAPAEEAKAPEETPPAKEEPAAAEPQAPTDTDIEKTTSDIGGSESVSQNLTNAIGNLSRTESGLSQSERNKNLELYSSVQNADTIEDANKQISEAYHQAKQDGSNPELVKAVESELQSKEPGSTKEVIPSGKITDKETKVTIDGENIEFTRNDTKAKVVYSGDTMSESLPSWAKKEAYLDNIENKGKKGDGRLVIEDIKSKAKELGADILTLKVENGVGFKGTKNNKLYDYYKELGFKDMNPSDPNGAMYFDLREDFTKNEKTPVIAEKVKQEKKPESQTDKIANIPFDKRTDKEHADYVKQKFVDQFTAKGTSKAQINAALANMEERAKREYPDNPDAFYRKIQDIVGGKKVEPQAPSSPEQEKSIQNEQEAEKPRNTATIVAEGEAVIAEAEVIGKAEAAPTQEEDQKIVQTVAKIERLVNEIDSKFGKLTESYSTEGIAADYPSSVIGKKAKKEINKYAKEIAKLTGWTIPAKNGVYDNIAPAGGEVVMHFDVPGTDLQIYATVKYDPDYTDHYDDYKFDGFFYRVENPKLKGTKQFIGPNRWERQNKTAKEFAEILSKEAKPYIDKAISEAPTTTTDKKAEVDKAIDEIWNYFGQLGIATSPEQQAKDLEMGIKLVGLYLKKGYYKLEDIVNAGVEKLGVDKMNSLLQYIKNGYLAYQSDATDEEIDKMDDTRTVRNYTIKPKSDEKGQEPVTGPEAKPIDQEEPVAEPEAEPINQEEPVAGEETKPDQEKEPGRGTKPRAKLGGKKLDKAPKGQLPDLFSGITEGGDTDSDRDQDAGGIRRKPSGVEEPGVSTGGSRGSGEGDVVSTGIDRENFTPAEDKPGEIVLLGHPEENFVVDETTIPTTFNQRSRFTANLDALKLLATLRKEKRHATKSEQEILSKYVGWGGLKVVLNPIAGTWTKADEELRPLVNELHEVISDLESTGLKGILQSIKRSVLSAFYTPLGVIKGMYTAIEQFGFTGGHVLDPSAGIGHFTGAMPGSIRGESKLTHVELDVLTGEILKNLYPNSNTEVTGLENAKIPKNYFDLVISNIPFGDISVYDKSFSTPELSGFTNKIHNYFFAKAIQQAKEGGLIAFVTSTGVMDSPSNKQIRQYINNNAEFIGAIRLPESTFQGNANTQVVSDIIFLRKKSNPDNTQAFLNETQIEVEHKAKGDRKFINVNEYFVNNPNHVVGEFKAGGQYRDNEMTVVAPKNVDLQREIERIVKNNFPIGIYSQEKQSTEIEDDAEEGVTDQFRAAKKSEIYIEADGKAYVKIDDYSEKVALPKSYSIAKINAFIELREALKNQYQVEGEGIATESEIETSRRRLNESYNRFISKHGLLHKKDNQPLLNKDINGFNILSLEKDKTGTKADIFSRRVIQGKRHLTSAANIDDAISISINDHGYVNMQRIGSLLNQDPIKIVEDNYGVLFYDTDGAVVTRSEYLSGNVKKKLSEAIELAKENPIYEANIKELRNVIPEDIAASDIEVNVGARWVMTKYYEQFASEIFKTPVNIHYSAAGDKYTIKANSHTVEITNEHGVYRSSGEKRIAYNGLELLEAAMHNVIPVVRFMVSKNPDKYETDKEATANAQEKQDRLKEMFGEWIWQDEKRRTELGRIYNDLFNTTIKRTHDGSKITIDGLNNVTLRPHQLDAIMMLINNKGGIIDHIVGAGKTYVMIAAAIKMKQIGMANKPTIIGLKSTIPHLVEDAKNAFPNAKILTPTESDFSAKNRKKFLSKIQNNDWDLIIMSHEQFGTIPQDKDIQIEAINEEIDLLDQEMQDASDDGTPASKAALKGLEKRKENLEKKLKELLEAPKDQEILNFKQIGIDHLMVDESQMFKNLEYATKINRIAGLGNKTGSKRAFNMLIAARTLQKMHNGDKGVTFSSGTVISNSLVEMYLLFKYLRPDKMKELGYNTFDSWVTQFAVAKTEVEFSVSSDLKQKVRFRSFINLPELSMLYNEIADVRNDSNLELPKPKIKKTLDPDGKLVRAPELIAVKQSEYQKEWTKRIIEFSNQKHGKRDGTLIGKGPLSEKEQAAAMLLVTNISSKLSVDMRLIDPNAEDNPTGKLSAVAEKAANIFHETTPQKSTQLIFSDIGTPKTANTIENLKSYLEDELNLGTDDIEAIFGDDPEKLPQKKTVIERMKNVMEWSDEEIEDHIKASRETEGQFNVYAELKRKLVAKGVPEDQVVFIHDYKTKKAKQTLFEKVKMGEIRIVIGSTQKLGTGVNVQHKLIAAHHVDAPWNPAAMEQRNGRIIRQKNENPEVGIYNYGTELTLDAYKYQLIASKLRFINQIKQGASNARVQDEGDGDEVTSQMMVAILSGNPLILKLAKVEAVLTRLRRSKKTFTAEFQKTETLKNATEARIPIVKDEVAKREIDYKTITAKGVDENGKVKPIVEFSPAVGYESTKELGQIINDKKKALLNKPLGHATLIAKVNGLELFGKPVRTESLSNVGIFAEIEVKLYLKGEFNYDVTSSVDPTAQGTAIGAAINRFKDAIEHRKSDIERDEQNVIKYANLLNNKWEKQDELDEAEAEFKRINKILFDTAKENERNVDEAQAAAEGLTDGKLRDNDLVYEPHDKDVFISVVPGKNTITGKDVYLARINEQLDRDVYEKKVKPEIDSLRGEWNRSSGNIIFNDKDDAIIFKKWIEHTFNVQNPQPLKFQKSEQTLYYEKLLVEDEKRLADAKKKLASRRSELYKIVAEDQAYLFGERKSQATPKLFDERADTDVESKLEELKRDVDAAQIKVKRTKENLEKSLGTRDNLLFQKTEPTPSGIINVDEITDISEFIDKFFGPSEAAETHFEEVETTAAPTGEFVYTPGFNWYSDDPAFVSGAQAENPTVYDATPKEEKIIKVRRGRSIAKSKRTIKNPDYKRALEIIPGSAEDYVKQAFIRGDKIHSDIIKKMFPKRTDPVTGKVKYATGEVRARIGLINNTTGFKTIGTFSERLWSDQVADIGTEAYTDLDFADAIEQVLLSHNGTASMVEDLIEKYYQESPMEREPSPEDIFYAEQQESANEDQEIDEIWDYFGDKEKDIEAEDQYLRDENGNILFQKTDMTPTSGESIAERIHKIKCP